MKGRKGGGNRQNNMRREKVKRQEEDEEVPAEDGRSNTDSKSNSTEGS